MIRVEHLQVQDAAVTVALQLGDPGSQSIFRKDFQAYMLFPTGHPVQVNLADHGKVVLQVFTDAFASQQQVPDIQAEPAQPLPPEGFQEDWAVIDILDQ